MLKLHRSDTTVIATVTSPQTMQPVLLANEWTDWPKHLHHFDMNHDLLFLTINAKDLGYIIFPIIIIFIIIKELEIYLLYKTLGLEIQHTGLPHECFHWLQ